MSEYIFEDENSGAMSRLHLYNSSDIPGKICQAFRKRIKKGIFIIEVPSDITRLAHIQQFDGIAPKKMTIDLRSNEQKEDDSNNKLKTSLN